MKTRHKYLILATLTLSVSLGVFAYTKYTQYRDRKKVCQSVDSKIQQAVSLKSKDPKKSIEILKKVLDADSTTDITNNISNKLDNKLEEALLLLLELLSHSQNNKESNKEILSITNKHANLIKHIKNKHSRLSVLKYQFNSLKKTDSKSALNILFKIAAQDFKYIQLAEQKLFLKQVALSDAKELIFDSSRYPSEFYVRDLTGMFPRVGDQLMEIYSHLNTNNKDISSKESDKNIKSVKNVENSAQSIETNSVENNSVEKNSVESKESKKTKNLETFLLALLESIKENHTKSLEILKSSKYIYSILLKEYILSITDTSYDISDRRILNKILSKSDDPSVLLYGAMILQKHPSQSTRYNTLLAQGLETDLDGYFVVLKIQDIITAHLKNEISINETESQISDLVSKIKNDHQILIVLKTCITFFLSRNMIEHVDKYIKLLFNINSQDQELEYYKCIYRAMFLEKINNPDADKFYKVSLELAPLSYESNLRYGLYLMNTNNREFIKYIRTAFNNSNNIREAVFARNVILSYEMFQCVNK